MTDKKITKSNQKTKKTAPKKSETVKKAESNTAAEIKKSPCPCSAFMKYLLTIIISVVVTASIIITTPLWMDTVLPSEKQPAFLRKALMPVTNVKVIKTKPLDNDIEKLISDADKHLTDKVTAMREEIYKSIKLSTQDSAQELEVINQQIKKINEKNKYVDFKWKNRSMQYKMFLVSFYNMYNKAMVGSSYAPELDLMLMNLDDDMLIHKDLNWVAAYKNNPPASLKKLAKNVDKNYTKIIIEAIKTTDDGFRSKALMSINYAFRLDAPIEKLKKGSLKYNLANFFLAAKHNNSCRAMRYGKEIAKQSKWFDTNILNKLEARSKINKELKKIKQNVEAEIYKGEIEVMLENEDAAKKVKDRYSVNTDSERN